MKITREEVTAEVLELLLKLRYILEYTGDGAEMYVKNPSRMLPSMQIRYKRIIAYFASVNIEIRDLKYFYTLEFIEQYKNYHFAEEIIDQIKAGAGKMYSEETAEKLDVKEILQRILSFRRSYIEVLEGFFGGMWFMGGPSVEEKISKRIVIDSIQDIDTVVERLNKVTTFLLFPQIREFDPEELKTKYNFPDEDYHAMEKQEEMDYCEGF